MERRKINLFWKQVFLQTFPVIRLKVLVTQSCPSLCNLMDFSSPGSSVHGILWARILEWIAIHLSRGSSPLRNWTQSPALLIDSLPSEPPGKPIIRLKCPWKFMSPIQLTPDSESVLNKNFLEEKHSTVCYFFRVFTQPIFNKLLLHGIHCARCWGFKNQKIDLIFPFLKASAS